jgi:hypothetical protein
MVRGKEPQMKSWMIAGFGAAALLATGCAGKANYEGFGDFGSAVETAEVMPLSKAVDQIDTVEGKPVVVQATVKEVCKNMGCWMLLESGGEEIRVRFTASEDCASGFFVPRNAEGHEAIVEGVLEEKEISEEDARHYAMEAGMPMEEVEKITGTRKEVTMIATGVKLSGKETLEPAIE